MKEESKKEALPVIDKKKQVERGKMISVTFRENRKFDLHVGRNTKVFLGRETKQIPILWLKHPDFVQAKKYFIVKGV